MGLLDVIAKDQVKIFGNLREFGEAITYEDGDGIEIDLSAFVEREILESKTVAGYGANPGKATVRVWVSQGEPDGRKKIAIGIDKVSLFWRRGDATKTKFVVTAVLPDSDGAWHLECIR